MSEPTEPSIYGKLAEIAGGVKLIDHKLDASNKLHDERHERTQADIRDLREKSHSHANGLQALFGWKNSFEGERQGLAKGGKALWAAIGFTPPAIVALLKLLGI